MSDEQTMPEVIYAEATRDGNVYSPATGILETMKATEVQTKRFATPYLRCDIDPADAVVVSRKWCDDLGNQERADEAHINSLLIQREQADLRYTEARATIATLTAERDALREAVIRFTDAYHGHKDCSHHAKGIDSFIDANRLRTLAAQLKEQDDE